MRFKYQVTLVITLFAFVPLLVSHFVFFERDKQVLMQEYTNQLESLASIKKSRLTSAYQRHQEWLSLITSRTLLRELLDKNNRSSTPVQIDRIRTILTDAKSSMKDILEVSLWNVHGNFLTSDLQSSEFQERLDFDTTPSYLYQVNDQGMSQAKIIGPISHQDKLIGWIKLTISLQQVLTTISDYTGLGATGETVLATKTDSGDAIFLTPTRYTDESALNITIEGQRKDIPIVYAINGTEKTFDDLVDYRDVAVLAVSRFVQGPNWGIVVKRDLEEVYAPIKEKQFLLIWFGLSIMALTMIAATVIGRRITQPISDLTNTAKAITAGEENVQASETNKGELGSLSVAFNVMTQSLNDSKEVLENVLHSSPNFILVKNKDLEVILKNRTFDKLTKKLGFKDSEFETIAFDPESHLSSEVKLRTLEHNALSGKTEHIVIGLGDNDSYNTKVELIISPFMKADGKIAGVLLIGVDISEKWGKEQLLVNQQHRQKQILDAMADAVITIDQQGTILTYNIPAQNLFQYAPEEVVGKNVSMLMDKTHGDNHDAYLNNYLTTGESKIIGTGRELEIKAKDGSTAPIRLSVSELPTTENGERHFVGTCIDLTKSKEQEHMLRQSQKLEALGKLTGGIAHDYNNLLGVILGYAELLEEHLTEDKKLHRYAVNIGRAAERGTRLTSDLLSFARPTPEHLKVCDINQILNANKDLIQRTITARISLELFLSQSLWPVEIDENGFEDILLNLCINSMHAIENLGSISISTENMTLSKDQASLLQLTAGDYVVVVVRDTGCGMSKDIMSKIFDPFFTTKGESGSGLGLSRLYGYMKSFEGNVRVSSIQGVGTSFTLYFHRTVKQLETVDGLSVDVKSYSGTDAKVLIVDDEEELANLASMLIQKIGCDVKSANSGAEALTLLEAHTFDCLITDLIMPDMDGKTLSEKALTLQPQLKIGFTSGFVGEQELNKLNGPILKKPFTKKSIQSFFHEIISADS